MEIYSSLLYYSPGPETETKFPILGGAHSHQRVDAVNKKIMSAGVKRVIKFPENTILMPISNTVYASVRAN